MSLDSSPRSGSASVQATRGIYIGNMSDGLLAASQWSTRMTANMDETNICRAEQDMLNATLINDK
jgi:hypothetical protein